MPDHLCPEVGKEADARRVLGGLVDLVVQDRVQIVVTLGVPPAHGLLHLPEHGAESASLFRRGPLGCQGCAEALESHPHLGDLDSFFDGERFDPSAAVALQLDQALEGQLLEGGPHRCPRGVESVAELGFHQAFSRGEGALEDGFPQLVDDRPGSRAADDRGEIGTRRW
ncbi:hypothetical protein Acit_01815 [Aciditerrimonas ferrireducens]|nr:hypothetical protein [Aciditerrimonas ferrireducens]MCK4176233.1 hypothetical protein [Aciditerrimonas ferrireducens]